MSHDNWEAEDGMGFAGLVPTAAEKSAERYEERQRQQMQQLRADNEWLRARLAELLHACRQAIVALKGREHDGFLRDAITKATGDNTVSQLINLVGHGTADAHEKEREWPGVNGSGPVNREWQS